MDKIGSNNRYDLFSFFFYFFFLLRFLVTIRTIPWII